jgi:cytosine/creatinine deaminase
MRPFSQDDFTGSGRYLLSSARVPSALLVAGAPEGVHPDRDGAVLVDILIERGQVSAIAPAGMSFEGRRIDVAGRHVWPMLVDAHAHLDKAHIVHRAPNPDGSFAEARDATADDRALHWSHEDLLKRMNFSLSCAEAHGVAAIRTHLDSHEGQAETTWRAFSDIRDAWSRRLHLQAVALAPIDIYRGEYGRRLADIVASYGGILGGVTRSSGGNHGEALEDIDDLLDTLFILARERNLDIDLHVDEAAKAGALPHVARATVRHGYEGRVTCGHCCSLALLAENEATEVMDLVRRAGISIVTLPTVNMYLQDRKPGVA